LKQLNPSVHELYALHAKKKGAIRNRLAEFAKIRNDEYFYELIYCLLTPQSSAVSAAKAVIILRENNFSTRDIDPESLLHRPEFYIRFHRTKARYLLAAKKQFPAIAERISDAEPGRKLREWLRENIDGMGWKEASHFLRNIGYRDLAILDRHILRNLYRFGVLSNIPKALTSKSYLEIEKKFLIFAGQIGISLDELDLLFWSMETGEILK